ncbi:MAG: hypothetical protein KDA95_11265 [Acidimicrobiales bacterium]|nr:hypothetical protein [Acidimicrobiales bacterium]
MTSIDWYWCLTHQRAESAEQRDDPDNALGPYASPEDARDWKRLSEERELKWKVEDEAWEVEPEE